MHRRTQDVFVSLLERAGYGFGYSEEVVRPDEAQTPREAQPPVDTGAPQPLMGGSPWGEDNQPAHNPDWTGLFTTSTDRRLQVWHELEEGLVERWVPLKGRLLASTTRLPIDDRRPASMRCGPSGTDRSAAGKVATGSADLALALGQPDAHAARVPA